MNLEEDFKGYDLLKRLLETNQDFRNLFNENLMLGKIRYFGEEEWNKIISLNYSSKNINIKSFYDVFRLGHNEGNCTGCSKYLSYAFDNISIAGGVLPILINSRNSEDGSHTWLETDTLVIDTSLLLVFDKDLKEKIGYVTENVVTSDMLRKDRFYQARKEYVNDTSLKR